MKFFNAVKKYFSPSTETPAVPLLRHDAMNHIADEWLLWHPIQIPPTGWVWVKDVVLPDVWCLITYQRGCLEKITRAEWRKVRRRRLKASTTPVAEA